MRKLFVAALWAGSLWLSLPAIARAQNAGANEAQAKAERILQQARAVLGSEAQRQAFTSLSLSATSHRTINGTPSERDIEYDIMLPDQFRRSESSQPFSTVTVMDDNNVSTTYSIPNPASAGDPLQENSNYPQAQARRRADFKRMMLALFLALPADEGAAYRYAGEWKEDDVVADMIDVTAKDGFAARLYFDQKNHRLWCLTHQARQLSHALRATMSRLSSAAARPAASTAPASPTVNDKKPAAAPRQQVSLEEMEKRRNLFEVLLTQAPEVEYRWVLANYKNVKGMALPHALTKSEDGHEYETWIVNQYKINPKFPAATFARQH